MNRPVPTRLGVYEKALGNGDLVTLPARGRRAGFAFVEVSIDDRQDRLARLSCSYDTRRRLRAESVATSTPVESLILSALRRWPLGSADPAIRKRGRQLVRDALRLARDLGAQFVQLPGYYSFHEPAGVEGRQRFTEELVDAAVLAGDFEVRLAIENMDGSDVISVRQAHEIVAEVGSPWVALQPDIGNLVGQGFDVKHELGVGVDDYVGMHLKDATPGVYRRVPFGRGAVPFAAALRHLHEAGYQGPFTIEMWNDDDATAHEHAVAARCWISRVLYAVGYSVADASLVDHP